MDIELGEKSVEGAEWEWERLECFGRLHLILYENQLRISSLNFHLKTKNYQRLPLHNYILSMRGRHLATNIIKSLRIRTIAQEGAFDYLEDEADPVKLFTSANKHSIQCLKQTALTNNLPSLSSNSVHDKVVSAFTIINTRMNDLKETPL